MDINKLITEAFEAQKNSYSPYSDCKVGAAILCEDGSIFKGCNIENSSFSVTNCAERTALFSAVANGYSNFEAIAVVGSKEDNNDYFYPCGVCLQALSEFCSDGFLVIVAKSNNDYKSYKLSELLPYSFGRENVL